ncbi:endoglucanase 4-like isoform X1, partial [Biomphalaria pfeifferi]
MMRLLGSCVVLLVGPVVSAGGHHCSSSETTGMEAFKQRSALTITVELHSWTVTLKFDQPINSLDVYTAEIQETKDGGKTYVLTNKNWNKDEHVGDRLCIQMQGH